jgi:hypothetical protein
MIVCVSIMYVLFMFIMLLSSRTSFFKLYAVCNKVRLVNGVVNKRQILSGSPHLVAARSRICLIGELGNDSTTSRAAQVNYLFPVK